jgi:hypothetical protein
MSTPIPMNGPAAAERQLMQSIQEKYGAFIDAAVNGTVFPAALLAGLTANEGALNPQASRLEPAVLAQLCLVLSGRAAHYGSIGAQDLKTYLGDVSAPATAILAMLNLAMSWGPTQIMGYKAVARGYSLAELSNLETHFRRTVQELDAFRTEFNLGASTIAAPAMFERFFTCWNAGSPTGKTFDPNYAANGVRRMAIYASLK